MNNLIEWFTKRRITTIFSITTVLFVILYFNIPYTVCKANFYLGTCREIRQFFNFFTVLLMITPFILFFSFFTPKMKGYLFLLWRKITFIYLFAYLFIVVITPWYSGDEYLHIEKDIIALIFSCGYFIFSLILIIYKSLKKERP